MNNQSSYAQSWQELNQEYDSLELIAQDAIELIEFTLTCNYCGQEHSGICTNCGV